MEGAEPASRSVWRTADPQQPPSLNSIRSDSGMNSMEYWDYTVELECIGQTPDPGVESECESEINRQMLKRNKELEDCIKFQRETIQDQVMRIEHLCRQSSMLREMTDSRLKLCEQLEKDVTNLEEENMKLREGTASDKARIQMLKLELEQCVQAIRDTELQQQHEDKLAGARNDEVRTHMEMERKAVEERELLTELAMSRMTDKMRLLEEENEETKKMLITMELQIERLREEREENEELDMNNSSEVVLTVPSSTEPECSCQCHLISGEPPHAQDHDDTHQAHQESRDQLISRLDTQYRELIDKYETLLDIVNHPPDQAALTPGAISLQEELGMLVTDTQEEAEEEEEEEEEEEVACCNTEESGSESSGFCDSADSLSEGGKCLQDEESQTEISSIISPAQHHTHQALHHNIFSQLFTLIRQEI